MCELRLTAAAMAALYGDKAVYLFEDKVFRRHFAERRLAGGAILVADAGGRIHMPDEAAEAATVPFAGVPSNLLFVAGSPAFAPVQDALVAAFGQAAAWHPPLFHTVAGWFKTGDKLNRALLKAQGLRMKAGTERMGGLTRQLVSLRQTSEQQALQLELARRMLEGIGYDREFPVFEAAADGASVGPGRDVDTARFSQILPVDLAGAGRVSVPVFLPDGDRATGRLTLRLVRTGDGACLAERETAFADLDGKPLSLDLASFDILTYGDLRLEAEWYMEGNGAVPFLRLAAAEADRFGQDGQTLAMTVFRRLADPTARPSEGAAVSHRITPVRFAEVMDSMVIPGGREAMLAQHAANGIMAVQFFEDAGYVQTHPSLDAPSAVAFTGIAPSGWQQISARVANAAEAAPAYRFVLARVPHGRGGDKGLIARLAEAASAGQTAGEEVAFATLDLNGGQSGRVMLKRDGNTVDAAPGDIVLMVLPTGDHVAYGWCRWYSLDIETAS